jgi:hypothetical protein
VARISHLSRFPVVLIGVVAAFALAATTAKAAATAAPAASCTPHPYAYAGLYSNRPAQGIQAVVTALAPAQVSDGHVAGWIGVGGTHVGPGGQAEWLQTGVNTMVGGDSELYVEITQPGRPIRYVTVASGIAPGTAYRLAVSQLPKKPGWWQVLVNGKPAIAPVQLPGSSRFQPMAMSESWNGGTPGCNGFEYRFNHLRILNSGSWHAMTDASALTDLGYKIISRTSDGFTALSA